MIQDNDLQESDWREIRMWWYFEFVKKSRQLGMHVLDATRLRALANRLVCKRLLDFVIYPVELDIRKRYHVINDSMLPVLRAGDEVLVNPKAYQARFPSIGDIVIALDPRKTQNEIIKRVVDVDSAGYYVLYGDNPAMSTDSRSFGAVPIQYIMGQVTSKLP